MAEEHSRSRLGRGLAALIGEGDAAPPERPRAGQRRVAIEHLRPNPRNPRQSFDDDELDDLARSIRERGILQPILVRADPGSRDEFEIIAGERRWRAAQRAGLPDVPVLVIAASEKETLEIAIVENVQRADLNPLEEALGYERLISEFKYSQNDLARIIGKSRSHVANTIRLLNLPESIRTLLTAGDISAGHARALLAIAQPETVARRIVAEGLTVRDVERIGQQHERASTPDPARERAAAPSTEADTRALKKSLETALGLVVRVRPRGEGGELRIRYATLDQLDSLCGRLTG